MSELILDPGYWRKRLDDATNKGEIHQAVFRCPLDRWRRIEAKHKTVFSWHRKTSRWVTGIDMHQYSQYQQVAKVHPIPLWLLFLHQQSVSDGPGPCPTGLYGQRIDLLKGCENHRHENWGKSGMVYWGESSLKKMAELRDMGL